MESGLEEDSSLVRARPARTTPVRRLWFVDNVWSSLWFVPACVALVAFAASRLTVAIDHSQRWQSGPGFLLPGDADAVATAAATITAAMLTLLAVVFSTTLVAVQLASSQYSPRLVRVFVRSRVTHATLAIFLATFMFALNTLVSGKSGDNRVVPAITVSVTYVLVLATAIMFVVFFHRIVRLLRVQYLFLSISRASRKVIEEEFATADAYDLVAPPRPAPTPRTVHYRGHPGVLQAIDVGDMADLAASAGCWIEMSVAVGENVGHGTPIARVHGDSRSRVGDADIIARLLVGGVRTYLQDPGCGIRHLVDAASRALSPAVNDPTTAVQALHRIADLLARVADRPDPTGWYTDAAGAVRVRVPYDDFERLATLGFTEILRYGADAPQVTRCLRALYDEMGAAMGADRLHVVERLRDEYDAAVAGAMPSTFLVLATTPDRVGLG